MPHIGVYTNCQGGIIYQEFLSKLSYFNEWDFSFIENYTFIKEKIELDKEIIGEFDIFLYQPVVEHHGIYTTMTDNGILGMLKPSCIRICFPCVYADIWPIFEENGKYHGEIIITDLISKGLTIEDIQEKFEKKELFFNLKERFERSQEHMRKREEFCHIKSISSYIEQNIQCTRLFYTQNHPTEDFFAYIAYEITIYLEKTLGRTIIEPIDYSDNFSSKILVYYDSIFMKNEIGLEYMSKDEEYDLWNYISFLYKKNITPLTKTQLEIKPTH